MIRKAAEKMNIVQGRAPSCAMELVCLTAYSRGIVGPGVAAIAPCLEMPFFDVQIDPAGEKVRRDVPITSL